MEENEEEKKKEEEFVIIVDYQKKDDDSQTESKETSTISATTIKSKIEKMYHMIELAEEDTWKRIVHAQWRCVGRD